jgi:hypothetical protein
VFEARVGSTDASIIRVGQTATIADGDSAPRRAVVTRRLPFAGDGDQSFLFWLAPTGSGTAPQVDRFGEARIVVGTARRAPAVPDSAVVQDDLTGGSSVSVVGPDGRAIWTQVVLGPADADGYRELKRPSLLPGTLVVTEGQRGLPDGTQVQWKS